MAKTEEHSGSHLVSVPAACRPRIGRGHRSLREATNEGAALMAAFAQDSSTIDDLFAVMSQVVSSASDPIDAESLEKLVAVANDLRGIAALLGSPLTAEIATLIFQLGEQGISSSKLSRPLLTLLMQTNKRLLSEGHDSKRFETELRILLRALRTKLMNTDPTLCRTIGLPTAEVCDTEEELFRLLASDSIHLPAA